MRSTKFTWLSPRHLTSIWKVNFVWKQHDQMIKENGSSICCALHIRQNNLNGSIDFMSKQKKNQNRCPNHKPWQKRFDVKWFSFRFLLHNVKRVLARVWDWGKKLTTGMMHYNIVSSFFDTLSLGIPVWTF